MKYAYLCCAIGFEKSLCACVQRKKKKRILRVFLLFLEKQRYQRNEEKSSHGYSGEKKERLRKKSEDLLEILVTVAPGLGFFFAPRCSYRRRKNAYSAP